MHRSHSVRQPSDNRRHRLGRRRRQSPSPEYISTIHTAPATGTWWNTMPPQCVCSDWTPRANRHSSPPLRSEIYSANTAYIKVSADADAELRLVSEEEFDSSSAIDGIAADDNAVSIDIKRSRHHSHSVGNKRACRRRNHQPRRQHSGKDVLQPSESATFTLPPTDCIYSAPRSRPQISSLILGQPTTDAGNNTIPPLLDRHAKACRRWSWTCLPLHRISWSAYGRGGAPIAESIAARIGIANIAYASATRPRKHGALADGPAAGSDCTRCQQCAPKRREPTVAPQSGGDRKSHSRYRARWWP